jgi:UDP-N-acetyl-D-mannosaminuronic acid dehydrogenase
VARPDLTFPHQVGELADVNIAYCPERVLPGKVVHELVTNDRVIGGITSRCSQRAAQLYKIFVEAECIPTNARTAEMCKLTENSFRDVNIAFANELSIICEKLGINVWELIKLANHHPRVDILQPGPGVGGHCIAVDPWFIVSKTPEEARLIHVARQVNDGKPDYVVDQVLSATRDVVNPVVACLGLAFKPDIDDLRESPAMGIVQRLANCGLGSMVVVEPHIDELPASLAEFDSIELVSLDEALARANVVLMLVSHKPFYNIDKALLKNKRIIDTRGVWQ